MREINLFYFLERKLVSRRNQVFNGIQVLLIRAMHRAGLYYNFVSFGLFLG